MAIWFDTVDLDSMNARSKGTMAEHLEIVFTEIGEDYLKATMPVDHRTRQPLGLLNGGASCALAETLGSTAANYCVNTKERYCVGLSINASHMRPARDGLVTATARPLHLGRSTQVWQIDICNANNKLTCSSRLTMSVQTKKS